MNLEKIIIKKVALLAREAGKNEEILQQESNEVVANNLESIQKKENDLRILGQLISNNNFAISVLVSLFDEV